MMPLNVADGFGNQYLLCSAASGINTLGAKPKIFTTLEDAQRFARGLSISGNRWLHFALEVGHTPFRQGETQNVGAWLLYRGHVRVFPAPIASRVNKHPLLKDGFRDRVGVWHVLSPEAWLGWTQGNDKPVSAKEAEQQLDAMDMDDAKVKALLKEYKVSPGQGLSGKAAIKHALAEGTLVLYCAKNRASGAPGSGPSTQVEESARDLPGSRPVEAPPSSTSAPPASNPNPNPAPEKTDEKALAKADSDVLQEAAESGSPFVEECQE